MPVNHTIHLISQFNCKTEPKTIKGKLENGANSFRYLCKFLRSRTVKFSVADPHPLNADPDPTFQFHADPDLATDPTTEFFSASYITCHGQSAGAILFQNTGLILGAYCANPKKDTSFYI